MLVLAWDLNLSGGLFFWLGGVTFYLSRRPLRDLAAGVFQTHGSSLKFTAIVLKRKRKKTHTASSFSSPGKMDWTSGLLSECVCSFGGGGWGTLEKYCFGFSTGAGTDPRTPLRFLCMPPSALLLRGGLQCNVNILQKTV